MVLALSKPFAASRTEFVPSELSPTRDEMTRLFCDVLEAGPVRPDDDFFDLGGDSLRVVNLMAAIETNFGVSLPVSAILEAPTPVLLADLVAAESTKASISCVWRVQEAGSGSPVVVVHGMGGDVAYARRIAAVLGPTRPVYGLRARGLTAGELPILGIPAIAAHYISELRSVRPTGPYVVAGYCGGAFVAYEMAQQLRSMSDNVTALIMVDPPLDWRRGPFISASAPWKILLRAAATVRLRWGRLRSRLRMGPRDKYHRSKAVIRSLWCSLAHYEPEPYAGKALMIHSREILDIVFNSERSLQKIMPNARFVECGETHHDLFATNAQTLAETKAFIEQLDPPI